MAGFGDAPPDDLSLGQAWANILRGLSSKDQWQQVGQGVKNVANIAPSVAESVARGGIAQVPGTFGDVSQLARQVAPQTMQNAFGQRSLPTTEEILQQVPRMTPNYEGSGQHETLGEFIGPALGKMLKADTLAKKGAEFVAPHLEDAANIAMNKMTGGLAPSTRANIVSPNVVNELGMATSLPKEDLFTQAVANTPSARISDEGLHINVMRKQKPEQAMTESVRSGVFYLPEGSPNIKHYGGSNNYGGTEKISGETLYKNPLFVKGATGGKAPEAAYLQLTDKNQFKQMTDDAFSTLMSQNSKYSYGEQVNKVKQFLDKYAPDLSDYADYIKHNSRDGNQLRYALQEAATAQKVRDAGYDAVIGHSKGKNGPFISELFDVRESHYPSPEGEMQMNPKFEQMYDANQARKKLLEEELNKLEK